ncbi:hypothetical protein ABB37_08274 [Leptomonas pyrrhocoris]|uniref:MINDY4 N-terminal dimerisation domain-containing protein n=1 Tax=Leptomonas pyrrhocoris TaxID=157538 RepID=A0A0M9FTP0_LEPPY|nr:hypothetical protein ABB37_08274 [Leptomonas pyrrhocoris]XP_015654168.1 hypothetical protein ABB37_08274 [Leptomonas pyrrhocoris]KPA75728.1 hypothetical protein ABB37_08274 [Leptomonas pyrrhocoris]KPA75729.1 hypothetical protein ABB37_08274 [Leptomonas pyrrhocoris]|eukprot:XP_015654167.1 hypothetical protein ABB37_08274 [Leptomonas pyrrhocoris]
MANAAPSASEKDKTARLVAALSCREQAELLAQALLREFMHRRGLHETLKAFDEENPRDERTISSRAVMRQLLNIPVEGRPSRLQPTVSASTGKAMPPTFMEELCSYRLTKRGYTHPTSTRGEKGANGEEEDPSDVEMRALHNTVDAHHTAMALCKQKQRRYEEMLGEEQNYQRRKEAHRRRKKEKDKRAKGRHRHSSSGGRETEKKREEEGEGEQSGDSDSETDEDEEAGGGLLSKVMERRFSGSLSLTPKDSRKQRGSVEANTTGLTGTGWQPPGVGAAGAGASLENSIGGTPHHPHSRPAQQPHSLSWTPAPFSEERDSEDSFDPFGSGASSQQALMARARTGSRNWTSHTISSNSISGEGSMHTTPKKASMSGAGFEGGAAAATTAAGQPLPLAALSNVPRGVPLGGGEALPLRPVTALGVVGGGTRLSSAPAGYNPNAVVAASGSLMMPDGGSGSGGGGAASREGSAGVLDDGAASAVRTPYSHGFPPPPSSALAPSIMVKHTDGGRRETATPSPLPAFDVEDGAAPHERSAASRRSGVVVGSPGGDARSPSPTTTSAAIAVGEDAPLSFHTPSRSANSGGGGGSSSGLRHGIGFRTSVSAEGTQSGVAAGAAASGRGGAGTDAEGTRHNRTERRVKLLID